MWWVGDMIEWSDKDKIECWVNVGRKKVQISWYRYIKV